MASWLDRLLPPPSKGKRPGTYLPDVRRSSFSLAPRPMAPDAGGQLPNASLIYGAGAAALITFSLYFLFTGMWLTGILLLLPAGCLLGFALHYMRAME
jgi:hypothetical protein